MNSPVLELEERKARLLAYVVVTHIKHGTPVGSKGLGNSFDVSDATIRNWLSEMEEQGLLTHPHTSAGRVPTDAGYRYFVDNLLGVATLGDQERSAIKEFFANQQLPQDMAAGASHLLAGITGRTSVVVAPEPDAVEIKSVILQSMSSDQVLALAILANGEVIKTTLFIENELTEEEISAASNLARSVFAGHTIAGVPTLLEIPNDFSISSPKRPQILELINGAGELFRTYSSTHTHARLFVAGTHNLVGMVPGAEPTPILGWLESAAGVFVSHLEEAARGAKKVSIGAENDLPELQHASLVISSVVDSSGAVTGLTVVLDGTRTDYGTSIAATEAVSAGLSTTFDR